MLETGSLIDDRYKIIKPPTRANPSPPTSCMGVSAASSTSCPRPQRSPLGPFSMPGLPRRTVWVSLVTIRLGPRPPGPRTSICWSARLALGCVLRSMSPSHPAISDQLYACFSNVCLRPRINGICRDFWLAPWSDPLQRR